MINMTKLDLNSLTGDHLAKGWSVVEWLMSTRKPQFLDWLEQMNKGLAGGSARRGHGRLDLREDEREWEAYVKDQVRSRASGRRGPHPGGPPSPGGTAGRGWSGRGRDPHRRRQAFLATLVGQSRHAFRKSRDMPVPRAAEVRVVGEEHEGPVADGLDGDVAPAAQPPLVLGIDVARDRLGVLEDADVLARPFGIERAEPRLERGELAAIAERDRVSGIELDGEDGSWLLALPVEGLDLLDEARLAGLGAAGLLVALGRPDLDARRKLPWPWPSRRPSPGPRSCPSRRSRARRRPSRAPRRRRRRS